MPGESHITTDHQTIQQWVETRGGRTALVKRPGNQQDAEIPRIDFPGYEKDESLEPIQWKDFFQKFEEANLAFFYKDELGSSEHSRFFKFVQRDCP